MGKRIYLFSDGKISRNENTLLFEPINSEKKFIPIVSIEAIYAFGELTLNKRVLEFLNKFHIPVHFFSFYGRYVGSYQPKAFYNSGIITLKQAECYLDSQKRLVLAQKFVSGGQNNILAVLRYYSSRNVDLRSEIDQIEQMRADATAPATVESLMGKEGNIREVYYQAFNKIITNPTFTFNRRTRNPPLTPLDALISFGNSLIYSIILDQMHQTHLDPRIGYLHSTNGRHFSLNLDVSEIFKPLFVDRTIFTLINRGELTKSDFSPSLNRVYLNDSGRKKFISELDNKLNTTLNNPNLKRRITYKSLIKIELYKIEKHILGDTDYVPFVSKW